ncbi:protocadherin-20 [Narcine bancroftii]|uniref:protocadherin-20 n=1 Tax=Narcine bancroftii TaxID=1343680 RepID=UPI003831C2DD
MDGGMGRRSVDPSKMQEMLWCVSLVGFFLASGSLASDLVYRVKEESARGTLIGNLATDLQLGGSAESGVTYNLASQPVDGRFVDLDRDTGELRTSDSVLDRESLCPEQPELECWLFLDIILLPASFFRLLKISILVEDVNDNSPRFPAAHIGVSVAENAEPGSRYPLEPPAEDLDPGANGVQTYRLAGAHAGFSLLTERANGGFPAPWLVLQAPLDREARDLYRMVLVAEDGGSPRRTGSASLTVTVTDVNDNCPRFTESSLNVTVPSNTTVGSPVARLRATDPDLGYNARIVYSYGDRVPVSSAQLFKLDGNSGVIRLAGPIREGTALLHRLTVLATGTGCGPVTAAVRLAIVPLLPSPPRVTPRYIAVQSDGVVYLKESEPARTPIAFFTVTDPGRRRPPRCYLQGPGPFRLAPYRAFQDEYLLETSRELDFELRSQYEVTVVAESVDGLALRTRLQILLLDENDNSPVFSQPVLDVAVEENQAPGTFLARVEASDADSGAMGSVTYALGPGALPIFVLDTFSGALSVSATLDREEQEKYRLVVRAMDGGTPPRESTATVLLTVLDTNDNHPRFINKDFSFFVPEDHPSFSEIGVIGVMDADAGNNGWVAMSILNGSDHFVIDTGKGNLMARAALDREQQSTYILWVQAIDGGEPALSAVAKVTVLLTDVNDNPPLVLFPQSNLSFLLVAPSTAPGSSITEVYAVDKDTGMNGVIAYSIIGHRGPRPETFIIDTGTGNITLHGTLVKNDYGLYRLLVKVSDHGYPEPLHSTVIVNLFVNESLSNESYIENLLRKEPDLRIEESLPETRTDLFQAEVDTFPCQTVLIALSGLCFGLLILVFALVWYISLRKRKHRHKDYSVADVDIPLNKIASCTLEKKSVI